MKLGKIFAHVILTLFALTLCSCECSVWDVQYEDDLVNDNAVVAYVRGCSVTTDYSSSVDFMDPGLDIRQQNGSIFSAYHFYGIEIIRISEDTVKVIYGGEEVREKNEKLRGVTFIYEASNKFNDRNFKD